MLRRGIRRRCGWRLQAFAADVEQVTGVKPQMLTSLAAPLPANLIVVGVLGKSPEIDRLVPTHKLGRLGRRRQVGGGADGHR